MSKKTLWIFISVLTLAVALPGTASFVGVNQWKAYKAEADAAEHRKERAEIDARISPQDVEFAASIRTQLPKLAVTRTLRLS